ncbi:MAG: hypothetical protein JNM55_20970 [Anaerolineales bacterium]|nr:hypothetical protein [Anaerolineales bacterium]
MRLEGQSKMGYYPTPEKQVELIKTWLSGQNTRWLDPCAGKGNALAEIARTLPASQTYGIELSDSRAEEATKLLDHVLNTAFEYAVLARGSFSGILLNPPYDGESETGGGTRLEERFLTEATPLLVHAGLLIYIIPHARISETIARHLAGWYTNLRCFLFAGDDYDVFKQVVILATKSEYHGPSTQKVTEIQAWANAQMVADWHEDNIESKREVRPVLTQMKELSPGNGDYIVPAAPERGGERGQPFRFKYQPVTEEDYIKAAEKAAITLDASHAWLDLVPPIEPPIITPAISPKQGHIAMQVTGGLLGTNVLNHDGQRMLLKGYMQKVTLAIRRDEIVDELYEETDDRKKGLFKVETEEQFRPAIVTLSENGELNEYTDPSDVEKVLKAHVADLVEIVEKRNVPLYTFEPESWEWETVSRLSLGRSFSGFKPGLTDPQKHLVIAAGRAVRKHSSGILNGEQGVGKTGMGVALAEYLSEAAAQKGRRDGYPVLVVAPGMVTSESANWCAEIPDVTPGSKAVVIKTTAKPVPKPARILDWFKGLADAAGVTIDLSEEKLAGQNAVTVFSTLCTIAEQNKLPFTDSAKIAVQHSLKQAEANPPTKRKGAKESNLLDGRVGGYPWLAVGKLPRDTASTSDIAAKRSLVGFITDIRNGRLPRKSFAILSYETAKLGPGRLAAVNRRLWRFSEFDPKSEKVLYKTRWIPCCPHCGQVIAEEYDQENGTPFQDKIVEMEKLTEWASLKRRFCQAPIKRRIWDAEKSQHVEQAKGPDGSVYVCGTPLFENSNLHRQAAALYIKNKARYFFPLTLVDEVHKAKGKGTGVGWALSALAGSSRYNAGLTGTLFGGYSTSIFWLLYRLTQQVRQNFAFNGELKWAEQMGLIKKTFYVADPAKVPEDGAFTGTRFFETVDEKPGISPAIARYILPYTLFAALQDIGLPLPAYNEHIVRLQMSPAMRKQYSQLDGSQSSPPSGLLAWALNEQKRPDKSGKGAISVWWNTIFNRPDAMFRDKVVTFNRRIAGKGRFAIRRSEVIAQAPAVSDGVLPKESWLIKVCQAQHLAGRKVLVYVRQTGERDIQERLENLLKGAGLRVEIMRPTIAPDRRFDWMKKHAGKLDVLITNARLVEVGLNLVMFPTAVFYEIEPSFYVLYQAMRRIWRPFAPLPVEIYFPVYSNSAEEMILDLMGEKMLSNQLLTGQEVGGALVPDDAGNILQVAVNRLLNGVKPKQVEDIFATQNGMTASPLGSPTATSLEVKPILTLEEWLTWHPQYSNRLKRTKKKIATPSQITISL